jgi:hypothetical protein
LTTYAVAHLDEIDEATDGRCPWRPVRRHFGITSFGVNAWTGRAAGDRIINEHAEVEHEPREAEAGSGMVRRDSMRLYEDCWSRAWAGLPAHRPARNSRRSRRPLPAHYSAAMIPTSLKRSQAGIRAPSPVRQAPPLGRGSRGEPGWPDSRTNCACKRPSSPSPSV